MHSILQVHRGCWVGLFTFGLTVGFLGLTETWARRMAGRERGMGLQSQLRLLLQTSIFAEACLTHHCVVCGVATGCGLIPGGTCNAPRVEGQGVAPAQPIIIDLDSPSHPRQATLPGSVEDGLPRAARFVTAPWRSGTIGWGVGSTRLRARVHTTAIRRPSVQNWLRLRRTQKKGGEVQ